MVVSGAGIDEGAVDAVMIYEGANDEVVSNVAASASAAHCEPLEHLRLVLAKGGLHLRNQGGGRALVQGQAEALQRRRFPLRHAAHAAVRLVPHPAHQTQAARRHLRPAAKPDALNAACYVEVEGGHYQFLDSVPFVADYRDRQIIGLGQGQGEHGRLHRTCAGCNKASI